MRFDKFDVVLSKAALRGGRQGKGTELLEKSWLFSCSDSLLAVCCYKRKSPSKQSPCKLSARGLFVLGLVFGGGVWGFYVSNSPVLHTGVKLKLCL